MKRKLARILRRLANQIDPPPSPAPFSYYLTMSSTSGTTFTNNYLQNQ